MPLPVVEVRPRWHQKTSRRYMLLGELDKFLTLIEPIQPKSMVEFGVNVGITAKAVLGHFPDLDHYVGIDVVPDQEMEIPWQRNEIPAEPGVLVTNDPRFELVLRPAREELNYTFDVSFIDGDHGFKHVLEDYETAKRITNPGGMIVFHDYSNTTVQVTEALEHLRSKGADIKHVKGTWLAFEQVPWAE